MTLSTMAAFRNPAARLRSVSLSRCSGPQDWEVSWPGCGRGSLLGQQLELVLLALQTGPQGRPSPRRPGCLWRAPSLWLQLCQSWGQGAGLSAQLCSQLVMSPGTALLHPAQVSQQDLWALTSGSRRGTDLCLEAWLDP